MNEQMKKHEKKIVERKWAGLAFSALVGLVLAPAFLAAPVSANHEPCSATFLDRDRTGVTVAADTTEGNEWRWFRPNYRWENTFVRVTVIADGFTLYVWDNSPECQNITGNPICAGTISCVFEVPSYTGQVQIAVVPPPACKPCDIQAFAVVIQGPQTLVDLHYEGLPE